MRTHPPSPATCNFPTEFCIAVHQCMRMQPRLLTTTHSPQQLMHPTPSPGIGSRGPPCRAQQLCTPQRRRSSRTVGSRTVGSALPRPQARQPAGMEWGAGSDSSFARHSSGVEGSNAASNTMYAETHTLYTNTRAGVCAHTVQCTETHARWRTHTEKYTHTHTHTHTHTCTHTHRRSHPGVSHTHHLIHTNTHTYTHKHAPHAHWRAGP